MEQKDVDKIEELLHAPRWLDLPLFEQYIKDYLKRKADAESATIELDNIAGLLQNHILSLSLLIKQKLLAIKASPKIENSSYYTKQEIANIFRVSVRTVSNWILDGLQTTVIGGIKRISKQAVIEFQKRGSRKKFNWKACSNKKVLMT